MELTYFSELKRTMDWLGEQDKTFFVGQTVGCPGTFMYPTLKDIPEHKRLEFPVSESFQMQFSIGLALIGKIPITVYPRQNFLLLATADMVNMLDKIPDISANQVMPHLIIRVASGPFKPVHPGHQHIGDFQEAFKLMFKNIKVFNLEDPSDIFSIYENAYKNPGIYLIVEHGNYYNEK